MNLNASTQTVEICKYSTHTISGGCWGLLGIVRTIHDYGLGLESGLGHCSWDRSGLAGPDPLNRDWGLAMIGSVLVWHFQKLRPGPVVKTGIGTGWDLDFFYFNLLSYLCNGELKESVICDEYTTSAI